NRIDHVFKVAGRFFPRDVYRLGSPVSEGNVFCGVRVAVTDCRQTPLQTAVATVCHYLVLGLIRRLNLRCLRQLVLDRELAGAISCALGVYEREHCGDQAWGRCGLRWGGSWGGRRCGPRLRIWFGCRL